MQQCYPYTVAFQWFKLYKFDQFEQFKVKKFSLEFNKNKLLWKDKSCSQSTLTILPPLILLPYPGITTQYNGLWWCLLPNLKNKQHMTKLKVIVGTMKKRQDHIWILSCFLDSHNNCTLILFGQYYRVKCQLLPHIYLKKYVFLVLTCSWACWCAEMFHPHF